MNSSRRFSSPIPRARSFVVALFAAAATFAAADDSHLANLSTRGQVGTGANIMITGFVIGGDTGAKKILLRAVGPGLAGFSVGGTLSDPVLSLYDAKNTLLTSNSGWAAADAATMTSVGAFPLTAGSRDAAIVTTLQPGLYTAQVSSTSNSTGVALLEAYDVSGPSRLINISTRAVVGAGNSTLIGGLVVAPGNGSRHLLIRAAGPALTPLGVAGANPDPALAVLDAQNHPIASNDNWDTANLDGSLAATATSAGAFPFTSGSKDAALLIDLAPGSYSVVVSGTGGAAGVALVEIYDASPASTTVSPSGTGPLYVSYLRASAAATASTAYGTATLQLAPDESYVTVNVTLANLSSTETSAHLVLDGNFIATLPAGNVNNLVFAFAPVGTYSAADLLAAVKAGRMAVTIDSTKYPSGELGGTFLRNTAGVFVTPAAPPAINLAGAITQPDAVRFLTQTTFGATTADIATVTQKGYTQWIADQMALPASSQRAATMADFATHNLVGGQGTQVNGVYPYPGGVHRQAAWWKIALSAPDQLRQRVAFALSELFVVSDQDPTVNTWQEGLASYNDLLVNEAFGNFRTLLEDVTLHPIMGAYLSALRNGRGAVDFNGVPISDPNENYAREVMQLFTIGLNQLNPDGTLVLDANGQLVPTYDQDTIVETAKVFTGWAFPSTDPNGFRTTGGTVPGDWTKPMMLYPAFHEDATKTIVGGKVLPANQGGAQDLKATLDALFNHPNTAPFVCRQLIQRLVTSNPSPGYIYRVAQVFANNGAGVRGDLAAVVKAILLDYEARSPALLTTPGQGKLKEPLLRLTAFLRAFGAQSDSGRYDIDAYPQLFQAALRSPTVFNFFQPDFSRPGTLAAAGLYSPEYQPLTDTTAISMANFFDFYINNPRPAVPAADNHDIIYLQLDSLAPLTSTPQALVDQIKLLLTANALSPPANDIIVNALTALPATATDLERVRAAIYLVVNAPEGATQK